MRYICTYCKLTSQDGHLWCEQLDCPAGTTAHLFAMGDILGNIEVLSLMRTLNTSVIYKAQRDDEVYFLKVANLGDENIDYIIKEAQFLKQLSDEYGEALPPVFPRWIYHGMPGVEPHGLAYYNGVTRYFYLMEYVDGDFLGDWLLDNPLPWHESVGYFCQSLSNAVNIIHQHDVLHLNLSPDSVYKYSTQADIPQPLLLDMGLLFPMDTHVIQNDLEELQPILSPAYTPYALTKSGAINEQADIFAIGVIMYEMLAGHPAYVQRLRSREKVYVDIRLIEQKVKRIDLPFGPRLDAPNGNGKKNGNNNELTNTEISLLEVVNTSLLKPEHHQAENDRVYAHVSEIYHDLVTLYDVLEDPYPKKPRELGEIIGRIVKWIAVIVAIVLLLITVVVITTAILN